MFNIIFVVHIGESQPILSQIKNVEHKKENHASLSLSFEDWYIFILKASAEL